jgi:hypothetical protein
MKENRTEVRLAHPEKLIAALSFPVAGESVGTGYEKVKPSDVIPDGWSFRSEQHTIPPLPKGRR